MNANRENSANWLPETILLFLSRNGLVAAAARPGRPHPPLLSELRIKDIYGQRQHRTGCMSQLIHTQTHTHVQVRHQDLWVLHNTGAKINQSFN